MTSVLYDVPGPRAIARNRILAIVTVILVLGAIGFVVYRMWTTGQFTPQKWYVFTFSNVWVGIAGALGKTLAAFGLAAVLSLVLGFVLAIGRLSDHRWVRTPVTVIIELFRAVPVLVFMMLLYYGLPVVGVDMDPYWAVVLGLTVYNGSVLAEALRAGIEALPKGQQEAGYAIGLRKSGVMRLILLPQAVRAMLPVIIAQLVVTLKDTALGFIITYPELLYYAKLLSSQQGRPILQSAFVIGGIYIALCLILAGIAKWVEVKTRHSSKLKGINPDPGAGDPRMHEGSTVTEVIALQSRAGRFDQGNVGGVPGI
ncbi:glutamate permease [Microbacterium esteraromaticum]|uniref:Glutamate permease n=1 Tax=Microbacterium esteraromaticum TaxID=57043 RepID=A0A1R4KT66_9MICO|nr:amino acid ABC transporter permease [Microbacterium esteraromaticum]SJN47490.1 glutamate permease [Microbacterium esteraromaticum]